MIYFDQAATSYPKPKKVIDAIVHTMSEVGANPGRSGHRLQREAEKIVNQTREKAAFLFGCTNAKQCLFFQNATVALNQAIKGIPWKKGDHVIATTLEHNAVRRPLQYIKREFGVDVTYVNWSNNDQRFLQDFAQAIKQQTKAIIATHACNVTGHVLPLQKMVGIAKENNLITIVDSSQTAGHIPIHMKNDQIDILAFPAHKGLLGPQGLGMLLVEGEVNLNPLHHGGTGLYSEELDQPDEWPYKYESGTLNTPGIAGFLAALQLYEQNPQENVSRETFLIKQMLNELKQIDDIVIYSPNEQDIELPIIAFNVKDISSQEIAIILDTHYNIAVRAGLHCNPLSHQSFDTVGQGMIRVSINHYNTEQEVTQFIKAINEIVSSYQLI